MPLLAAVAALAGCPSAPVGDGAETETAHYRFVSQALSAAAVEEVGRLAERDHARLADAFGVSPDALPPAFVELTQSKRDFVAFARAMGMPAHGGYGSWLEWFGPARVWGPAFVPYVSIWWRDRWAGQAILFHEQVHHFVAHAIGELPDWKNEGLAHSLAHSGLGRGYARCPVEEVRDRTDPAELEASIDRLLADDAPPASFDDLMLAGALVRFGLETQGWTTLGSLASWRPDRAAFVAWLRSDAPAHTRLPPVVEVPMPPEADPAPGPELLPAGGFEQPGSADLPLGWEPSDAARCAVAEREREGGRCLVLEPLGPEPAARRRAKARGVPALSRLPRGAVSVTTDFVAVEPGREHRLTATVRCEARAQLLVLGYAWVDGERYLCTQSRLEVEETGGAWRTLTKLVTLRDARKIQWIRVQLRASPPGTARFDDISFRLTGRALD